MKLYTCWISQASFRVRVALRLKRLEAEMLPVNILAGEQFAPAYRALNAGAAVPTLLDGDGPPLRQSLAILEYLDESYPEPPLLPAGARARARVRALAQTLAIDAHPFVVPRVRKYLETELHLDEPARMKWLRHWMEAGLQAVEPQLAHDGGAGRFCHGDAPTMADICLVAHVTSANMLKDFDMAPYPTVQRIVTQSMGLDAFAAAQPRRQADAPAAIAAR